MIGADRWMSEPPGVRKGVAHGQTKSGDIVLAVICWSPWRPETVLTDRALCLPIFSHFLIVNKTSLSPLSLSLSPSRPLGSIRSLFLTLLHTLLYPVFLHHDFLRSSASPPPSHSLLPTPCQALGYAVRYSMWGMSWSVIPIRIS